MHFRQFLCKKVSLQNPILIGRIYYQNLATYPLWNFDSSLDYTLPLNMFMMPMNLTPATRRSLSHRGLKLQKRFTNLSLDSSRCPSEKGRSWMKWKRILEIQLKFCIFYMFSLFHPVTHYSSWCQKIQANLCSDFGEVCEPFRWF